LNRAQKSIVKEAKKRNIEVVGLNDDETFRKSRMEVKKLRKQKKV
jgi:hypothetical protein